jgi:hypothetical protein
MQQRLSTLLARQREQGLTPREHAELDAYSEIEHIIVRLKAERLTAA